MPEMFRSVRSVHFLVNEWPQSVHTERVSESFGLCESDFEVVRVDLKVTKRMATCRRRPLSLSLSLSFSAMH